MQFLHSDSPRSNTPSPDSDHATRKPWLSSGRLIGLAFVACLALALWNISYSWFHTIWDAHAFRQTQTAMTSLAMLKWGHWANPELPVLGAPWQVPFEFPLYQWLVAGIVAQFDTPLEQTGRAVSAVFFGLSLVGAWFGLGFLQIRPVLRLLPLAMILTSPLLIFWARTFMIESTAAAFSMAYLAAVAYVLKGKHRRFPVLAVGFATVMGCIAGLLKATTFVVFCSAAGGLVILHWCVQDQYRLRAIWSKLYITAAVAFAAVPVLVTKAWTNTAESIRMENPIAATFLSLQALESWNFGTWAQRFSLATWERFFNLHTHLVLGSCWILVAAWILWIFAGKRRGLAAVFLFAYASGFLLFTNLYWIHDYYAAANGVFAHLFVGTVAIGLIEQNRPLLKKLGGLLVVWTCIAGATTFPQTYKNRLRTNNTAMLELGQKVREVVKDDEVILVYGADWSSEVAYAAQRRALIDRANYSVDSAVFQQSIANIGKDRIAALLSCGSLQENRDFIKRKREFFDFADHYEKAPFCTIISKKNRKHAQMAIAKTSAR